MPSGGLSLGIGRGAHQLQLAVERHSYLLEALDQVQILCSSPTIHASRGPDTLALAHYLSNGALDTTFSADGRVKENGFGGTHDWASALVLQPDGKLVVAGYSLLGGNTDFGVRYLPNGTLDGTFAGDGNVRTNIGTGET